LKLFKSLFFIILSFILVFGLNGCKKDSDIEPISNDPIFSVSYTNITRGGEKGVELNDEVEFRISGVLPNPDASFAKFSASLGNMDRFPIGQGNLGGMNSIVQSRIVLKDNRVSSGSQDIIVSYVIKYKNGTTKSGEESIGKIEIDAEKKYEFDQMYGEGYVYNTIKANKEEFARILSDRGDVTSERGTVITYDMWLNGFSKDTDGNDNNGELKNIWMDDRNDTCAGVIYIRTETIGTAPYFIGNERTAYLIRNFFEKHR